jgi:hypothetical protein
MMDDEKPERTESQRMYEERMALFVAAVTTGAIGYKGMPSREYRESAAGEIVAFAEVLEMKSRRLFE